MSTNVLLLMTDQHRVDTLGCYGNPTVATPHLDRLAAQGTRFDQWLTPTAICTPARASLLTGQAPFRHRLLANAERNVGYLEDLDPDTFTYPAALREQGYRCGLIGKWHTGTHRTAASYGFESVDLPGWHNPVEHPDYLAYLDQHDLPGYAISDEMRGTMPNGRPGNLLAARLHQPVEATFEAYLATRAIEWLTDVAAGDAPFALSLNFFGPHLPYVIPDAYFDRYDLDQIELPRSAAETFVGKPPVQANYSAHWAFDTMSERDSRKLIAVYWGYVTMIDEQIGRVLGALDQLGLDQDTAVFFTADHGEFTGAHRLHDKGPAMYEDIYRTPGLLRVPGGPSGQVRSELVSLTDCTATILDLAGCDPGLALDSRSLLPLARGEQVPWDPDLVCEFHGHHFPYPQRMLRTDRYKLVVNPDSVNELYDLQTDPDELHNAYADEALAGVRAELVQRLYLLLRERGDNFHHWMTSMYEVGDDVRDNPSAASIEGDAWRICEEPR